MSGSTQSPHLSASSLAYDALLRRRGPELVSIVAAIAESPQERLTADRRDDDEARVVIAITLLAAGLPIDLVASPGTPLRSALDTIDDQHGIEFYLLNNGLRVEHFHLLRERLDDASAASRGDVA